MIDFFAEEEARLLAEAKAEIAAEDAAYNALTDEEKAAKWAAAEAKWNDFADACEAAEAEQEDEEEDEE